jgi:hypothetical protein
MTNYSHRGNRTTNEGFMGAIKSNPEGLLLLAAGCALLMRSGSLGSGLFGGAPARGQGSQPRAHYSNQRGTGGGIAEAASETADRARRYVADVGSAVSETAKDYASSIGSYASDAQRAVVDSSERLMEQARTTARGTVSRVLQEQPLSLVLLGLATGAAVASVLPRTSFERETLGAVGERVSEIAGNVRENLGEAASQAGEKLKQVADERGLNAEGLKEAAQEVAGAFGSAFKGEETETGKQQSGGGPGSTSNISSSARAGTSVQPSGGQRAARSSADTEERSRGASGSSRGASGSSTSSSTQQSGSSNSQPQTGGATPGSSTKRS